MKNADLFKLRCDIDYHESVVFPPREVKKTDFLTFVSSGLDTNKLRLDGLM